MIIDPATLAPREAYALFVSTVVPRPIAFVTSMDAHNVVNAAPYSFFNAIASSPPLVLFSAARKKGAPKHTTENILLRKEFVINIVNESLLNSMNLSSGDFPPEISKMNRLGLTFVPSVRISVPRIAESPIGLECTLNRHIVLDGGAVDLMIGEVCRYHVWDELMTEGTVDQKLLKPIARMGGKYYATVDNLFEMERHHA
jgi:flavin reductase (DIM6/NTAB) family NADH-FMN oxidoreductase RutF